ncbi:MAG TPA: isoprenylcysteine carboxylmethyltransferase family protein [Gemmatimonadaceae bacterium]|nr:isoprenylcysteine carboxylmethyltransferase family protein [Gemmatimonadaceae bacterium]
MSDAAARDRSDIPNVIAPPPLIYLVPLLLALALHWRMPMSLLPSPWPLIAGPVLFIAGLCLVMPALAAFGRAKTRPQPWRPSTALVIEGPYRFTRNPMYVGFTLIHLGITCAVNSVWPLLSLVIVLPVMQLFVIRREERYMERRFGAAYREYMTRVRRWI